jgi:hypothetical protein
MSEQSTLPETLLSYSLLLKRIDKIKQKINQNKNCLVNYFFNLFGYKFQNKIQNPNFYHYTSEAWILTILKQLKEELDNREEGEIREKSFNELLKIIKNIELDESLFIENLEFLLGTSKTSDHVIKITQMKLSQLFLKKTSLSIKETLTPELREEVSDAASFQKILFLILEKAVNFTLNELDSKEEDKSSLLLLNVYTDLYMKHREHGEENFLNEFVREIKSLKEANISNSSNNEQSHSDINLEVEVLNPCQTFYFFANSSFEELLQDIFIFSLNSGSALAKIKRYINAKYSQIKSTIRYPYQIINSISLKRGEKFGNIKTYLHNVYENYLKKNKENAIEIFENNYQKFKNWIDNSKLQELTNNFNQNSKRARELIVEKIYNPLKTITITYSQRSLNFFISLKDFASHKKDEIATVIEQKVKEIFGDEPLIKFNLPEGEEFFNIEINKRLMVVDSEKIKKFTFDLISIVRNLEIQNIIQYSKEKGSELRQFLIQKFRSLISAENKECEKVHNE